MSPQRWRRLGTSPGIRDPRSEHKGVSGAQGPCRCHAATAHPAPGRPRGTRRRKGTRPWLRTPSPSLFSLCLPLSKRVLGMEHTLRTRAQGRGAAGLNTPGDPDGVEGSPSGVPCPFQPVRPSVGTGSSIGRFP